MVWALPDISSRLGLGHFDPPEHPIQNHTGRIFDS
jgi:hypothetical protein